MANNLFFFETNYETSFFGFPEFYQNNMVKNIYFDENTQFDHILITLGDAV